MNGEAIIWILFQEHFSVTKRHLQEMESTIFGIENPHAVRETQFQRRFSLNV